MRNKYLIFFKGCTGEENTKEQVSALLYVKKSYKITMVIYTHHRKKMLVQYFTSSSRKNNSSNITRDQTKLVFELTRYCCTAQARPSGTPPTSRCRVTSKVLRSMIEI